MTTLFQQMIANGASFDEAARWQHADDLQRFRNRESANYGVYEPAADLAAIQSAGSVVGSPDEVN